MFTSPCNQLLNLWGKIAVSGEVCELWGKYFKHWCFKRVFAKCYTSLFWEYSPIYVHLENIKRIFYSLHGKFYIFISFYMNVCFKNCTVSSVLKINSIKKKGNIIIEILIFIAILFMYNK